MTIFINPNVVAVTAQEVTFTTEDATKYTINALGKMPRSKSYARFANTVRGGGAFPRTRSMASLGLRVYRNIALDIWPVTVKVIPYVLEYSNEYKFVIDAAAVMPRTRSRASLNIPLAISSIGVLPRARSYVNVFMPPYDVTGLSVMPRSRSYGLVGVPVALEARSKMPRAKSSASIALKDFVVRKVVATTTFTRT